MFDLHSAPLARWHPVPATAFPSTAEPAPLLDTRQAARLLGLSVSTLNKWRFYQTAGAPPFVRFGSRAIRYERAALLVWIASSREASR